MKILFADTNIFLRFFLNDIPFQALQAKTYFEKAKKGRIKIIVVSIVIFEIIFALERVYKAKKEQIIKYIKAIVSMPFLEVENKEIFIESLRFYEKGNIDFVDIFIFCAARARGGMVLSFDKDFKKLDKLLS